MATKSWQEIQAAKKSEQASRIPRAWKLTPEAQLPASLTDLRSVASSCGLLSPRELGITSSNDATSLAASIASGRYTAVEVVTAFCKRAAVAQQVCNCLTEIMFDDAVAATQRLDEEYERTRKTRGRLHGVPVTFKPLHQAIIRHASHARLRSLELVGPKYWYPNRPRVYGPLDLRLLTRTIRDMKPWLQDPAVLPHVLEQGTSNRKPVIVIIHKSGLNPPPGPIRRALLDAVLKFGCWNEPPKAPEEQWSLNACKAAFQKQMLDRSHEAGIDMAICPAGPHTAVFCRETGTVTITPSCGMPLM